MSAITEQELAGLEAFSGDALRPDDGGYDDARRAYNGLIDKRPALIARCLGEADIADAIALARGSGLEVSVRGGGHNVAGRVEHRRRCDDRPLADEGHPRRPEAADGPRAAGRQLGRAQP